MTDRIELKGIEVYARHGVLASEQQTAQVFKVDVAAFLDLARPAATDRLEDTVDYGELATQIREVVGGESHALIERVASRVAEAVLAHDPIHRVIVTIHKPDAPVDVALDDVTVTIERTR